MSGAAFVDAGYSLLATGRGALEGVSLSVKDVFDLEGRVTGAGCPAYAAGRAPAARTAPAVARLLQTGATLRGVTVTEEMMFGVLGQMAGGTPPPNPRAPDRLPGGSSSGAASAVASGGSDIALGTDTGGSVRVPASFCGIYGFRPGPGRVPMAGVVPLAPRFDTVGWFARSAEALAAAGEALLDRPDTEPLRPQFVWLPPDLLTDLPGALAREMEAAAGRGAEALGLPLRRDALGIGPEEWGAAYKVLQSLETWRVHGDWVRHRAAALGPLARARFAAAARVPESDRPEAEAKRQRIADAVLPRLAEGGLLLAPTTPGPAPFRNAAPEALEAARRAILRRTALGGLLGLAEASLPALGAGHAPVGLSLISPGGTERGLLAISARLAPRLCAPFVPV